MFLFLLFVHFCLHLTMQYQIFCIFCFLFIQPADVDGIFADRLGDGQLFLLVDLEHGQLG